jgi:RNA 2',3'-cyclic 3'-phosphodiesterase
MQKIRAFIAVEIPISKEIHQVLNELKKTQIDAKIVETQNMHLTLKFLGDTDEKLIDDIGKIIKNSAKNIPPFQIALKSIGVFPNQNYIKVAWIGVENTENLKQIAETIDSKLQNLGFEKEKRPFSAHLTIARIKSAKNKEKLIDLINKYQNTEFQQIKIDKILLKKSTLTPKGPIYTNLKEIKLGE